MCFPLSISQNRNTVLYAAIQENLQGAARHHPPLRIPLVKGDMDLPEGAGRHSSGARPFWQQRKSSGYYLATAIILKSGGLVLAGRRFISCICLLLLRIPLQRERSWEESTLCWKEWKNRGDTPEAQASKAALLLDREEEEGLKWKEEGERERRKSWLSLRPVGSRTAAAGAGLRPCRGVAAGYRSLPRARAGTKGPSPLL